MNNVRINYEDINKKELNKAIENLLELTEAQTLDDINHLTKLLQKFVLEQILNAEMEEHLGYDKNKRRPKGSDNYRNGTYPKIVRSSSGNINLEIPRDRKGEFSPQIVKKGVRDISNIEDKIIYLYTQGLSTRDISKTIRELYEASVSAETASNITERIKDDIKAWQSRQLNPLYPIIFMDGTVCKVKIKGKVQRCTVYVCIGIDCDGNKEVLSVTRGETKNSKFWLKVLNDLKSKGVQDVFIFCTDNLPGMTEAIKSCYPEADHQKCIVHQVRNSVKYVPYK